MPEELGLAERGRISKEAGGRRPPASFKTSPLPRFDSLQRSHMRTGGGVGGEGGGWPRPLGKTAAPRLYTRRSTNP